MDAHHQHLLWIYHNVDDIRWVGILDRIDPSFRAVWITQAIEQLNRNHTRARWLLLSTSVYDELCRILVEPRKWLDELDLEILIDDKLTLRPDLFRMVFLDKDYMTGTQILWVKSSQIFSTSSTPKVSGFETILSEDIL